MSSAPASFHDVRAILQKWDKGSPGVRHAMLRDFVSQCSNATAPELERQFGDCASLFLARLTVWLRLNYLRGNLKLLLKSIGIFLSSSSGHHFLAEFLEVGGALTVLEVIGMREGKDEETKSEGLRLLGYIADRGRQFKELLCESYAVKVVAECLAVSASEVTQELAQNLLHQLFKGNPHYQSQVYKALISLLSSSSSSAQRLAAHTLTLVQADMGAVSVAIVEPTLQLLRSPHTDVQHEACSLLGELVRSEEVQQSILAGLVHLLKLPDTFLPHLTNQNRGPPPAEHLQQAGAARVIRLLVSQSPQLIPSLIPLHVVPHLLHAVANTAHNDAQKQASLTLHALVKAGPSPSDTIRRIIGQSFLTKFLANPNTFYTSISPSETDVLLAAIAVETNS